MLWQLVWVTETMESKIIHECVDHVLCCSKEVTRLNPKSRVREYILPSLKGVLSNTLARVGGGLRKKMGLQSVESSLLASLNSSSVHWHVA